jgi:serine/threonine-protein kinase
MAGSQQTGRVYCFGQFRLDPSERQLFRGSEPISLTAKVFDTLLLLVENSSHLMEKDDLMRRLWPDTFVDEATLAHNISSLRKLLGETENGRNYIETVPKRGYRFVAPVTDIESSASPKDAPLFQPLERGTLTASVSSDHQLRERLVWAAAAVLVVSTITLSAVWVLRTSKSTQPMRLTAEIGADASLNTVLGASAILSPDGTRLAFVANDREQRGHLYVRRLDELQASLLPETENALDPFFSPDGEWIGFFADRKLKKISVHGGPLVTLCEVGDSRGGSWSDEDTIVFAPEARSGLSKISSTGGIPEPLTMPTQGSETTYRWPQVLPGDKAVLFSSGSLGRSFDRAQIVAYTIATGQQKVVLQDGFYGHYVPSGHLLYIHEGTLFAVPFDVKGLKITGPPAPMLEGVVANPATGGAQFSFSEAGSLIYVAGRGLSSLSSIYWMERDGKFTALREAPGSFLSPAFSPDGMRLAMEIFDGKRSDIWTYDWGRDTLTRTTFGGESNRDPIWTPDGQRITYTVEEKGKYGLYWKRADGAGDAKRLTESPNPEYAGSWRPDGKFLAFSQSNPQTGSDIMILPMEGNENSGLIPGEPKIFLNGPYEERSPAFSPDGRWLAYSSNESGNYEVYVQAFPGPGERWQISTNDGQHPKWSRNGNELFYCTQDGRIMEVVYRVSGTSFVAQKPQVWSTQSLNLKNLGALNTFDLHPDGRRFAVVKAPGPAEGPLLNEVTIISNFSDEVRRKFYVGRK